MAGYGFQVNGDVGNRQIDFNASNMMPIQIENSVAIYNRWAEIKDYFPFLSCCTENFTKDVDPACEDLCYAELNHYNRLWCTLVPIDNPRDYQPCVAIRPFDNDMWTFAYDQAIDTTGDGLFDTLMIVAGAQPSDLTDDNYNTAVVGYVDLIVFNYPDGLSPSTDTHGTRIYDENTNLIFDSGYQYLKILKATKFDLSDVQVSYSYTPVKSDSYYIMDFFANNQQGGAHTWYCAAYVWDYISWSRFLFNGITKDTSGNITFNLAVYAYLFGCVGLISTSPWAPDLTLLEVELT